MQVVPFKPFDGYVAPKNSTSFNEQYMVSYNFTSGIYTLYEKEIFKVPNSRAAHKVVEAFAKKYLKQKHNTDVEITSVTYC